MSAEQLFQAADDARRLLRGFQAFEQVGKALELAAGAEQAMTEAQSALKAIAPQIEAAKAELADAKADGDKARAAAKKATADAKTVADGIVSNAEAKAAAIVETADQHRKAQESVLETAVSQAAEQVNAKAIERDALAAEVKDLEARAEKARSYLNKLAQ